MRITIETQPTEPETWPLKDAPDGWLEPTNGDPILWRKCGELYAQFTGGDYDLHIGKLSGHSIRPVRRAATPTEIVIRQGAKP